MAKFPGKVMLDVADIASLTAYSKGHIYNLASAEKLPFVVSKKLGDLILVSIVEMSDYLDRELLTAVPASPQPKKASKGPGRPRGSTSNKKAMAQAFQAELGIAIENFQAHGGMSNLPGPEVPIIHKVGGSRHDEQPFFIDVQGLVLFHGQDPERVALYERFQLPEVQITWATWTDGLAMVWRDESARLGWLGLAESETPGIATLVEAERNAILSRI